MYVFTLTKIAFEDIIFSGQLLKDKE